MDKSEVLKIMGGPPASTEFYGPLEEWHFCDSGTRTLSYQAIYFNEGVVYAARPYSVMVAEETGFSSNVATFDCSRFIKRGNYREPDEVREYRLKMR